ncbi:serine protease [Solitalea sp. MAHUQ-68]|uniref:Serine protease n=1 Tax=Solitalea agri TaxID=2953739 RepID=A0A9X2F3H9_9SPHI|nr:serine protease [Solitalea agri]MCO4293495.1 serine protease [Solitalea agri]
MNASFNNENHTPSQDPEKQRSKWLVPTICVIAGIFLTILFFKAGDLQKLWSGTSTDSLKCGLSQTAIYEKYKNSVVLVANSYVYEVSIKGSEPIQFTVTDGGEIAPYDQYANNPITITGTGFFVSKDGKLVTNRHVASPWTVNASNDFSAIKATISYMVPDDIEPAQIANYIKQHWTDEITEGNEDEWEAIQSSPDSSVAKADSSSSDITINIPERKTHHSLDTNQISIKGKIVRLGIAMHNSKAKNVEDFIPCEFISQSEDPNVDVAILQTLSHNLPSKVKNIIDLSLAANDDTEIKPGAKAVMIGYPMGMQLAGTIKGIKVQVYEGEVNKESDGFAVQYNITSTHGASGSPVFDDCGRLIAVNFAGYDQAQGFNFGVVAKYALALYENE